MEIELFSHFNMVIRARVVTKNRLNSVGTFFHNVLTILNTSSPLSDDSKYCLHGFKVRVQKWPQILILLIEICTF